jgi:uncharacterized phage-associated protein
MKTETLKYLPAHIANYFLWRAKEEQIKDMTPMKLIKLVYFAYAWNLAIFNKKLFSEKIEAWRYGPVVPSIYHEFKRCGDSPIDHFAINFELGRGEKISFPVLNGKSPEDLNTIRVVETIWRVYKDKSGWELSDITHHGDNSAWKSAYAQGENSEMDDKKIIERAEIAMSKYKESLKTKNL